MSTTAARPPFDLGRVIGSTFSALTQTAPLLLPLALVLVALPTAAISLAALALAGSPDDALLGRLIQLVDAVLQLALQAAVIQAMVILWQGRKPELRDCTGATRHLLPLFGIQFCVSIGIILGLLLLVVPGLIAAAACCVAAPARVVEGRGVFESISRSLELTRGARLPVFGLLVGGLLVVIIALGGVSAVASFVATATWPTAAAHIQAVANPVASAVMGVFQSIGLAAIFFELRRVKEGAAPEDLAAIFD